MSLSAVPWNSANKMPLNAPLEYVLLGAGPFSTISLSLDMFGFTEMNLTAIIAKLVDKQWSGPQVSGEIIRIIGGRLSL